MSDYLGQAFRGSWITSVSDEGVLSIPRNLRRRAGPHLDAVIITSITGESGRIYSMWTWQTIKEKLDRVSDTNHAKRKFVLRTNYYGAEQTLGPSGLQLLDTLRESAGLKRHVILDCPAALQQKLSELQTLMTILAELDEGNTQVADCTKLRKSAPRKKSR